MKLYFDGTLLGSLSHYSYETPWASAHLTPEDPATLTMLSQVSHFINIELEEFWGDMTPEEETAEYDRRLAALGITHEDVDNFQYGRWEVKDANPPDPQGFISLYDCSADGALRWQW